MVSYLFKNKATNYKLLGVIGACILVLLIFSWGVMEVREQIKDYDCLDIHVMKTYYPNNLYLFVADDKAEELGC